MIFSQAEFDDDDAAGSYSLRQTEAPFFSAYFPDSPRSYPPPASPRISFLKFS
jgi:hypothetical protein